jgi:hypothetical protein
MFSLDRAGRERVDSQPKGLSVTEKRRVPGYPGGGVLTAAIFTVAACFATRGNAAGYESLLPVASPV